MAWDFSTEPEFEEQLAWMRQVVRDDVIPLETLSLSYDAMLEEAEDLRDRLSIYEAEGVTIGLDKLEADLGLAAND